MAYEIWLYATPSGKPIVKDFIFSLSKVPQAKLARQLDLLEEFGPDLGMPHVKHLGGGLLELRVRGKQEIRIFYAFSHGKVIYLLHGFIKKSQATPKYELEIARLRKNEVANGEI